MVSQQTRRGTQASASNVASALSQPTEMVKEYPVSSMLLVFGVGLGVGVLLAQTVCDPMIRSFTHEPSMMERFGQRMYETLQSSLPESVARRMS